ncbi:MAG: NAD+ synthase [Steroidobacteraceae bacterium]
MSLPSLQLALAQTNLLVGDVSGNTERLVALAQTAHSRGARLLVTPELALAGYPPEDLLFHRGLRRQLDAAIERLTNTSRDLALLVGLPEYASAMTDHGTPRLFNAAWWLESGRVRARHRKHCLPNYRVFDEKRYFEPGSGATVVELDGFRLGLLVCEDIWEREPAHEAVAAGAEALLVINASPFEIGKQDARERVVRERVTELGVPVIYLNLVGGQDELVFDGQSFALDADGELAMRASACEESLLDLALTRDATGKVAFAAGAPIAPPLDEVDSVYRALVLGTRDYVEKHRFPGVVLGLSGGVDSALTLAIAVDALGADRVQAVMMPSRYTSTMSLEDAATQARSLGVQYSVIPIEGMFEATLAALASEFAGRAPDATEENIQSRCRMQLLMGISNKTGRMLLTTGNKSEMAVGYATLYGDMAGGFAPIKDCSKQLVYRLAHRRNEMVGSSGGPPVIPWRVIEREPSAELRPDQKDSDSLPPYEILDPILAAFIEEDLSVEEIVARGFERTTVVRVLNLVQRNEYKRRQAPPGVRVSGRAFGRDWRYPITSGYRR